MCYVCKTKFSLIHYFYHSMCPDCASFNFAKRSNSADLRGKFALVTGGRTKIGLQIVLSLVRDGCTVFTTTRFPIDALRRFSEHADWDSFKDKLNVICVDFKITESILEFCDFLKTKVPHLDIIINNAA